MKALSIIISVLLIGGIFITSLVSSYAFHCAIILFCAFNILFCIFHRMKYIWHIVLFGAVTCIPVLSIISVVSEYDNGSRIFTARIEAFKSSKIIGNTTEFSYIYKGKEIHESKIGTLNGYVGANIIMASPYNAQNHFKVLSESEIDFFTDSIYKVYENGIYHVGEIDKLLNNISDNPELRQKYEASMDNGFLKFYRDYWYLFAIVFAVINVVLCRNSNLFGRLSLPISFLVLTAINYTCHSASYYLLFIFAIIIIIYNVSWSTLAKYRVPKEIAKCGGYIVVAYELSSDKRGSFVKYVASNGRIVSKKIEKIYTHGILVFPFVDDDDCFVIDSNPSPALIKKFQNGVFVDPTDNISLSSMQSSETMKEKYMSKYKN